MNEPANERLYDSPLTWWDWDHTRLRDPKIQKIAGRLEHWLIKFLDSLPPAERLPAAQQLAQDIVQLQCDTEEARFYRMMMPVHEWPQLEKLHEALQGALAAGDRAEIEALRRRIAQMEALAGKWRGRQSESS